MDMRAHILAGYRNYARFTGRTARPEFWTFAVFLLVALIVLTLVAPMLGGAFLLVSALPGTAATVRRLHDMGRTGWWVLLPAIVLPAWLMVWIASAAAALAVRVDLLDDDRYFLGATGIAFLAAAIFGTWLAAPSDPGPNAYGPAPQGGAS
ncbi:DUF805 domain-containing protein [Cognatishimia sp. F0-27]|uniref:DUF805 domain-containing protein n=1 Tax=Cognatishimia sp. F0-27 TaxID=2816855 RepID=UPI001D0CADB8|nr:DUF805 domain-containing protein [Cognatishimia sp. F0-27]MCC1491540.1 DUF805 domain-containing protein [Cognatishimia sp. F0-27]